MFAGCSWYVFLSSLDILVFSTHMAIDIGGLTITYFLLEEERLQPRLPLLMFTLEWDCLRD